jgi:farnesyl-diphosphate farnesyltransferase
MFDPDQLLKKTGRTFYLTAKILPKKLRQAVTIGYLLARITDTIADAVDLPPDGRLNMLEVIVKMITHGANPLLMQKLQPALDALPPESDLRQLLQHTEQILQCLHKMDAPTRKALILTLNTIVEGQRIDIERFHDKNQMHCLETAQELDRYLYCVAGSVGKGWTEMSMHFFPKYSDLEPETLFEYAIDFGKGLQLVNILRDLPQDLRQRRCYIPREFLELDHINPDSLLEKPEQLNKIGVQLWEQALNDLQHGWLYMKSVRIFRIRFSLAVTLLFAFATLHQLRHMDYLNQSQPLKISHAQVRCLMLMAGVVASSPTLFSSLLRLTPYSEYVSS